MGDTAGQERFARVLLPTYFRKAKGVILVYDITNAKSFESLSERWMTQLNDHASSDDLAKLLVGNKSDLDASREVSKEKAEQFCIEFRMERMSLRHLRSLLELYIIKLLKLAARTKVV